MKCRICGGPLQSPLASPFAYSAAHNPTHVHDVDNGYVYRHSIYWCTSCKFFFIDHQRNYVGTTQDVLDAQGKGA